MNPHRVSWVANSSTITCSFSFTPWGGPIGYRLPNHWLPRKSVQQFELFVCPATCRFGTQLCALMRKALAVWTPCLHQVNLIRDINVR